MCFGYIKGLALAEYYVLLNMFKTIRTIVAAGATFEMTIRHPSEDVEQEVGQRGESLGGKEMGVISLRGERQVNDHME